jgi:hypothetical protein
VNAFSLGQDSKPVNEKSLAFSPRLISSFSLAYYRNC